MQGASKKSSQLTLWDTDSVTGLLESEDGHLPSGLPDSNSSGDSGRPVCHANPYRLPAESEVRKTNGTCGQNSIASSQSVCLQSLLASSLQAKTDVSGSMEFRLIWKNLDMPSQRQICQLQALGHRTEDSDSTGELFGWPTPNTMPDAPNMSANRGDGKRRRLTPQSVVGLVPWPTPLAITGGPESAARKQELGRTRSGGSDLQSTAQLAGWGTPRVTTNGGLSNPDRATLQESRLEDQVQGWATPCARDWKDSAGQAKFGTNPDGSQRNRFDQLARQVFGMTTGLPNASTASKGVLEPAFVRWLMGYPAGWDQASPSFSEWSAVQERIASVA